jgi:hypothetical protein
LSLFLAHAPRLTHHDAGIMSFLFAKNGIHKIIILMKTKERRLSIRYKLTSRDIGDDAFVHGNKSIRNFHPYRNATCLGLLVVLTCPAAWGQIGWWARTETSAMAMGA